MNILGGLDSNQSILLNGMEDGPFARVIGVFGNLPFEVSYKPNTYIEFVNQSIESVSSLYRYQLNKRLTNN